MKVKVYCITCNQQRLGIIECEVGDKLDEETFSILKGHKDHHVRTFDL